MFDKIKLFADGADLSLMNVLRKNPKIRGFTTNPSLARKVGITNYLEFAKESTYLAKDLPISLEVISDDFEEMERQAILLSKLGKNVFVKIPITNTKGESSCDLIRRLTNQGIPVNVTAVFTWEQIEKVLEHLNPNVLGFISIFAGRIADTGIDPRPLVSRAVHTCPPEIEIIWASPREIYNIKEAEETGCHIITVFPEILNKLHLLNHDLTQFSLDTVKMFYDDACKSGFKL